MKTTVLGVFPHEDDARRVVGQLVASTLDLDAIRVLHKQPEVQRAMAAEAGLPADRTVPAGIGTGAFLGGVLGFGLGLVPDLPLAQAGPLFLGALGLLAGGVAGGVLGGMTDALPVPREQLPELTTAVDGGAVVVLVRTDSQPTARAIRDLFQAAGSAVLTPPPGESESPDLDGAAPAAVALAAAPVYEGFGEPTEAMAADDPGVGFAAPPPAPARPARVPFWRRVFRGRRRDAGMTGGVDYGGPPERAGGEPDYSLFMPRPASAVAESTVAPWERVAPPDAEPARYEPPQAADVAEDAAPPRRRRRKPDNAAEAPALAPDEPPPL